MRTTPFLLFATVYGAVIKVTKTELFTQVEAPQTHTKSHIELTTVTTTRYTSTVTTTVFGTPITYATTISSTQAGKDDKLIEAMTENDRKPSPPQQQTANEEPRPSNSPSQQQLAVVVETVQDPISTATKNDQFLSSAPSPLPSSEFPTAVVPHTDLGSFEATLMLLEITSSAAESSKPKGDYIVVNSLDDSVGPTFVYSVPSSTDLWIIDSVSTLRADGFCIVNYDYYYDTDLVETVTETLTVFTTVTV